jgi:hypothetical protein
MTLNNLLIKQESLNFIKQHLINKGFIKDISYLNGQIDLISEIFNKEALKELDQLLKLKTNYRLLVKIDNGSHNIVDILNNPMEWCLSKLCDNPEEYLNTNSLIFSTERYQLVFSKNELNNSHKYINNKWQ